MKFNFSESYYTANLNVQPTTSPQSINHFQDNTTLPTVTSAVGLTGL